MKSPRKRLTEQRSIASDFDNCLARERVDNTDSDPVQSTRSRIGLALEFPA